MKSMKREVSDENGGYGDIDIPVLITNVSWINLAPERASERKGVNSGPGPGNEFLNSGTKGAMRIEVRDAETADFVQIKT